jgi:hypothetical protein
VQKCTDAKESRLTFFRLEAHTTGSEKHTFFQSTTYDGDKVSGRKRMKQAPVGPVVCRADARIIGPEMR